MFKPTYHSLKLFFISLLLAAGIVLGSAVPASAATYNNCSGSRMPTLKQGDRGSCVTKAQNSLRERGFMSAQATGYFGSATRSAVVSLQQNAGIASDGIIGRNTWGVLNGQSSANANTSTSALPAACRKYSKAICVDKGSGSRATLYAIENGAIIRTMDARTGDTRPGHATDEGTFRVYWKSKDHVSSIYNVAMPFSLFYNGGEAIHYSESFATGSGYNGASRGCVNLRSLEGAEWLFNWAKQGTRSGTPVIVTP